MKRVLKSGLQNLHKLKKEKNELEAQFINPRTSNFQREKITMRLREYLLPAIRHLEKTLQSQARQTMGLEAGIQKIKKAQNMLKKGVPVGFTRKAPAPLTAAEKKEVENFEKNLEREFGPITEKNILNEARRMKAHENALLQRIMVNYKRAKTQEQRNYYGKMIDAVLNESSLRPITPEEEAEVNAYFAQLKGGKGKTRRLTRRHRTAKLL